MGRKLAQCTSCGFALPIQSLPICVWCQLKLPDSLVAVDVSDPSNRAFKMRRASEPLFKKRLREERAGRTRRIRVSVSVTQLNDALPEVSITAEEEVERPKLREREDTSETVTHFFPSKIPRDTDTRLDCSCGVQEDWSNKSCIFASLAGTLLSYPRS